MFEKWIGDRLNTCNPEGRIRLAGVIGAALPAVCIFGFGAAWPTKASSSASEVGGRPPGPVFGIAWIIVTVAWFVSLATASIYMCMEYLIAIWILNAILVILAVCWLYVYNKLNNKVAATQLLYFTWMISLLTIFVLVCAPYETDSPNPKTIAVSTLVPLIGWLLFASNLGLQEINLKNIC